MHKMKIASSLVAVAIAASPALADDRKNYPGNMCQASGSLTARIGRSALGFATNLGPNEMPMHCPAVKDFDNIAGAVVHVVDEHETQPVECDLRYRSPFATIAIRSASSGGSAHGSAPVPLTFGSLLGDSEFGFYILSCAVPPPGAAGLASGVATYQINEND